MQRPLASFPSCGMIKEKGGDCLEHVYKQVLKDGRIIFHRNYCMYNNRTDIAFDAGTVRLISLDLTSNPGLTSVKVFFDDGSSSEWITKWITSYNFQFGIAPSVDGACLFVQTWENGLFCLDSRTGEKHWRTKSKRGITNLFVNDRTVLCHQHEYALQLLDIHSGAVLAEKRPAKSWGFTSLDHTHIVCQVTARRWEIIDAGTLEVKRAISHREFTGGHEHFCINHIKLDGSEMIVRGFQNVWDNTVSPAKRLPNLEFEHRFPVHF